MSWDTALAQYQYAATHGFVVEGTTPRVGYRAKPGSHDDGPHHGPFLGGLGTGCFSRDLTGRFSRWHMEPGLHVCETVPQAALLLWWRETAGARSQAASRSAAGTGRYLGVEAAPGWEGYLPSFSGFPEESRSYAVLFPDCFEHYDDPGAPVEVMLHYWSPLVFGDEEAAAMPVIFFELHLRSRVERPLEVAAALFWPNILGWRHARVPSVDRGDRSWPGQTHSGNTARAVAYADVRAAAHAAGAGGSAGPPEDGSPGVAVVQERRPEVAVTADMEGQVGILARGPAAARASAEPCMKADQNAIPVPASEQRHTQAWAAEFFAANGRLPATGETWEAHWHEPLSSAVALAGDLSGYGASMSFSFTLAWDMPLVRFGSERTWRKRYTAGFTPSGRNAVALLGHATRQRGAWRAAVESGRRRVLDSLEQAGCDTRLRGAVLNELFLAVGGGTAWVAAEAARPAGLAPPRLGAGEHFGLLEGFDTGYFYYDTLDLWVYAFPAVTLSWPGIAERLFDDYIESLATPDERERIIYRLSERRAILVRHKAPHDLGCPMGDPWHELNGYTMRDDPNSWKDHNPALVISAYCHARLTGQELSKRQWELLDGAGEHILAQDETGDGLPRHREFGDSTWDALALEGVSAYSAGLTLAAYRALAELAERFGVPDRAARYDAKLESGRRRFEELLWTGAFYRTDSGGRYREAVMADALIGPYYASLAGLGELLPLQHVRAHLEAAFEHNFTRYEGGEHGALLVSDTEGRRFSPDGAEELQINEVIVGSAWALAAMLQWYGLDAYAQAVSSSMRSVLYERSGLQFRTPAAWDASATFRAPLNMRPLSIWLLAANAMRTPTDTPTDTPTGGSR